MNRREFYGKMDDAVSHWSNARAEGPRRLIFRRICDEIAGEGSEWSADAARFARSGDFCDDFGEDYWMDEIPLQRLGADKGPYGFQMTAECIQTPGYRDVGYDVWHSRGNEGDPSDEEEDRLGAEACDRAREALSKEGELSEGEREAISFAAGELEWLLSYAVNGEGEKELMDLGIDAASDLYGECGWRQFRAVTVRSKAMGAFYGLIQEGKVKRRDAGSFFRHARKIANCEAAYPCGSETAYAGSAFRDGEFVLSRVYQGDAYGGSEVPFAFGLLSFRLLGALEDAKDFLKRMDARYGFIEERKGGTPHETHGAA